MTVILNRERVEYYDGIAEHFDQYYPHADHLGPIDEALVGLARGRVLEIGSGTGRLLGRLSGRLVVGVEPSQGMCRVAARRGLLVVRAAAEALPFRDGAFDVAVSGDNAAAETVWHLHFPEVARVLAPHGRFAFHLYNDSTHGLVRSVLHGIHWSPNAAMTLDWVFESHVVRAAHRGGLRLSELGCSRRVPLTGRSVFLPQWMSHLCDSLLFLFRPAPDPRVGAALAELASSLASGGVASVRLGQTWQQPPLRPGALVRVVRALKAGPGELALIDEPDGLSARRVIAVVTIAGRPFHLCDGPDRRVLASGELQGRVLGAQTSAPPERPASALVSLLVSRIARRLSRR